MLPLTDKASFFGTVQPLAHHLAPRLRAQAPLVSIATFSSEPSTSSLQSSWTQQLVRPGANRPPSLEAVSPAVSSNVQVLGAGLRTGAPAARGPAERRYRRKPKLRVAVDVDEGTVLPRRVVVGNMLGQAATHAPVVMAMLNILTTFFCVCRCSAGAVPPQLEQVLPGGVWPPLRCFRLCCL